MPASEADPEPETFAPAESPAPVGRTCHAPTKRTCSLNTCKAEEDRQTVPAGPADLTSRRQSSGGETTRDRRFSYPSASVHQSFSAHVPKPAPGAESEPFEEFEISPSDQRGDQYSDVGPLKLEKRGVTPQKQLNFWESQLIHKESIVAKLKEIQRFDLSAKIADCHTIPSWLYCNGCHKAKSIWNRCEQKFCPVCQPRLAKERKQSVEWWTKEIPQPKHVVLTCRNTETITKSKVLAFKRNFQRLRRSRFCDNWEGGFYSLEVTNEGRGWHLHLHALVNSRFIDAQKLAILWGKIVGQEYAIVCVKDVRKTDYLAEVTKYACKGSQLASWSPKDIADFVDAFDGVRTFGVFGELYTKRQQFREWLDELQKDLGQCECGCSNLEVLSPDEMAEREIKFGPFGGEVAARPPPQNHPEFEILKDWSAVSAMAR